ncbi:phosphonate C-P lyase system protein PhnH [Ruegeria pomeroyi]|nr:phosphonate C-P lyase system protein PhnH [Ruegeria pomeroyi]NVK98642.1 phosphonate C-P lyase system protein PhnH [Ruegeria pomeroyi]NVL03877.1 phosphonate C-P lyase system protein PhnH [Ruegeria pomeroyi]QWV07376.1 phosphonate C-P lyase system protein PhnH [Ruegeria pomeroyi]HCE71236.1 phosphonate C-P lyase system protein PhnH [Ruegeria sp.]
MDGSSLYAGGFRDAPVDAAHAFRAAMSAMARPGDIRRIAGAEPPAPLSVAAGTLLLTLCDPETRVHLAGAVDTDAVRQWLSFHTGAPLVDAAEADFALGSWADLMPLSRYRIGTPEYPDRSAALIVECDALENTGAVLSGPGIRDTARLSLPDVDTLKGNAILYPLGCDFFFTCGDRVAALPRSTTIVAEG